MLFKLSISNLRKSIKDYAIYFFTLIIGVSVFYVFSAVGTQAAYMQVARSRNDVIEVFKGIMSGLSVFVAGVLGLLIAYASRFLMKKRNREFALYMLLGMGKRKIAAILLLETLIIGIGSLAVGLVAGVGLSQFMSAVVANLFAADMTAYRFVFSGDACVRTIIYFGIMYIVVMVFNAVFINRCKLIDLIQSGKRSEDHKARNPWICTVVFVLSVLVLAVCYRIVAFKPEIVFKEMRNFFIVIAAGCVSTFFIFWSVAGLLLRIVMSLKGRYYRGLNSFTFRQLSSKVNTMVFSMTVICLMLFVTISALAASFSLRITMNKNIETLCPVDFEYEYTVLVDGRPVYSDAAADFEKHGIDLKNQFEKYVSLHKYSDENLTWGSTLGENADAIRKKYSNISWDSMETVVTVSDYNRLMELYGRKPLSLEPDEYIMLCNFQNMVMIRNEALKSGTKITVFGHELKPKYDCVADGFIDISSQPINLGVVVVDDSVVDADRAYTNYLMGIYKGTTKAQKREAEDRVRKMEEAFRAMEQPAVDAGQKQILHNLSTRDEIAEATVGLTAIITFMGLYIGVVFLISCGAILALKELSDSVDNVGRYEILRKIGAEEGDISRSLFIQTGLFFLLPLVLGAIHSAFGLKFAMYIFEVFGMGNLLSSIVATALVIVMIYGGYFLVTYASDKAIIRDRMA